MKLRVDQLRELYRGCITKLGGSPDEADVFANIYVTADLRGMDWQGLKAINRHIVGPIREGVIRLGEEPVIIDEGPASLAVDGRDELGQLVCSRIMDMAIGKASESGSCTFAIRNAADTGLLAAYTLRASAADCVGLMCNNTHPYVAPWGGDERTNGIDPLSIAVPAGEEYPVVLDMALTPAQPFHDVMSMWAPPFPPPPPMYFETVREYALSVMVELMCGCLNNMPLGRDKTVRGQCAVFGLVVHVPHFTPIDEFKAQVDRYVRQLRATKPAEGSAPVTVPGERGFREQDRRLREGIPVAEGVWVAFTRMADDIGLDWEGLTAAPPT
jgi:L-2-hydroxycarboxylate dehydrogenase (NAD+)